MLIKKDLFRGPSPACKVPKLNEITISKGNDPFYLPHFNILLNYLVRTLQMNRNGKAGVFAVFGFLGFNNRAGIVENGPYLINFLNIRRDDEFIEVCSGPLGRL